MELNKYTWLATQLAGTYRKYSKDLYKLLAPVYFKHSALGLKNLIAALLRMEEISPAIATKKFANMYFLAGLFDEAGLAEAKQALLFQEDQDAKELIASLDTFDKNNQADEHDLIEKLSNVVEDLLLYYNGIKRYHGNLVLLLERNPLSQLLKGVDRQAIKLNPLLIEHELRTHEREIKMRLKTTFGTEKVMVPPLNRCKGTHLAKIDLDKSIKNKQLTLTEVDGALDIEVLCRHQEALKQDSLGEQIRVYMEYCIEDRYAGCPIPYKEFGLKTIKNILKIQLIAKVMLTMEDVEAYKQSNQEFLFTLLKIFEALEKNDSDDESRPDFEKQETQN